MVLLTLATTTRIEKIAPVEPFIYAIDFSYAQATYWTTTFGAPVETVSFTPTILDLFVNFIRYYGADSLANCKSLESSWYLDGSRLYVHLDHDAVFDGQVYQYGKGQGYSDTGVVYVDTVEHLPLVVEAPGIARAEDIKEYQRLTLLAADVNLTNRGGALDYLKSENIIGNSALFSYLSVEKISDGFASASDVQPQAFFFVEKISIGRETVRLSLQDIRKQEKKLPDQTFSAVTYPNLADGDDGKFIPIIMGPCRAVPCVPVTSGQGGTTDATFRCAEVLTAITAVRVKIEDTWTARTPSSVDLANGTFTIPNARSANGQAPYECQADVVGVAVSHSSDCIKYLYLRGLDQQFTDQFYDLEQWASVETSLPVCGIRISEPTDILDIIPQIQNGTWPSFRFDITFDGKKTIILDDREKPVQWVANSPDIANIDTLEIEESPEYLFGKVTIQYDKNYTEGSYRAEKANPYEAEIREAYQWSNTNTIETLLTNSTDAQAMADAKAEEYRKPVRTCTLELMGDRYFGMNIYDILWFDTTMGREEYYTGDFEGRAFFGVLIGQVISVAPNYQTRTVTIRVRILDRDPEMESYSVMGTEEYKIILTEDTRLVGL